MRYHKRVQKKLVTKKSAKSHVWQVWQCIASVIIACIALLVVPTLSWLSYRKSLETTTRVNRPNALVIGAGDAQSISQLELSDVDVSGVQKFKDVVFCVYSKYNISYYLQLAHTTNIGFTYTIFPATMGSDGEADTVSYLGKEYSFDSNKTLAGQYINQSASTQLAEKTGTYHDKTYNRLDGTEKSYDNVQAHAEPLYWKTNGEQQFNQKDEIGDYINYYVLRISWNDEIWNNKETDMVYLMAESLITE